MKFYRYSRGAAASLAGMAAISGAAHANSVDYGALEQLFNEPVTTSATGAPQRVTEAPVNMTIITQDDIRKSGAIDIPGVLERFASVDVDRNFRGDAEVSVRGYNQVYAPRLLVLVNGRQVYLDHYGLTNWDAIPVQLSEIRQIEMVRGPNTALFGFNAVGGVINILTYDALRDDVDEARLTGGSDYVGGSFVITQNLTENVGLRVSAGGFDAQAMDAAEDAAVFSPNFPYPARDPSARTASATLSADITEKTRLDFETTWSSDDRTEPNPSTTTTQSEYETNSIKAGFSSETGAGLWQSQVYRNEMSVNMDGIDFANTTLVGSTSLIMKLAAAHTLRVAGEYRRNEFDMNVGGVQLGGVLRSDIYALSGMWNWQATRSLALTSALRVDYLTLEHDGELLASNPLSQSDYDQDTTAYSYNIGAVQRLSDRDVLRFSIARGIQTPSMVEYGMQLDVPTLFTIFGSPRLDPTITENIELGWDRDIPAIHGGLRSSVYWQRNRDLAWTPAYRDSLIPPYIGISDQIGDSTLIGFEIGIEGRAGDVHWSLDYSHREVDDDLEFNPPAGWVTATTAVLVNDAEHNTPANIVTAGATWERGAFEFGGDARYVDEHAGVRASTVRNIDSYVLVNAQAVWHASDRMSLSLSGRNLFDDQTETTAYAPTPRAFYLTLSSEF